MITQQFRPFTFDEVVGQDLNVKILKSLVKSPETSPRSIILFGAFGCGKCVPKDVRILTENGYYPIGEYCLGIEEGFTDHKGYTVGRYGRDNIVAKYYEKQVTVHNLQLNINNEIKGTYEHRVLAYKDGEIDLFKLGELKEGDYILFPTKPIEFKDPINNPHKALIQSAFLSGRIVYEENNYLFKGNKGLCSLFKACSNWVGEIERYKDEIYCIRKTEQDELDIDFLKFLISDEYFVPKWIFNSDIETRRAFIRGVFDFQLYSKSYQLIKDYQEVLKTLGIPSYHNVINDEYRLKMKLDIQGNEGVFSNNIKINEDMMLALRKYKKSFPRLGEIRVNDTISESQLKYLKEYYKELPTCLNKLIGYTYAKIKTVYFTTEDVYDITTERYHEFFAQGTFNHNTTCARIFARELNKDDSVDLDNSPYYMELDSASMGSVDNIRELRDTFAYSSDSYWKVIVLDECLHYNTTLLVRDENKEEKTVKIGDLVSKKPKGWEALSYNNESGETEWKPITDFFKTAKKNFYKVQIKTGTLEVGRVSKVVTTLDHRYFTPEGKPIFLSELKVGDKVLVVNGIPTTGIIESIEPYKDDRPYGYDITVADNHNYISSNVVLHNCHLLSPVAQSALLKVIEEAPKKVFFIFATTNPEKLLKTIRSRSIELRFNGIVKDEMFKNLRVIADKLNSDVSDEVLQIICNRSRGHMRNAHMLLDKYFLIGEQSFLQSVRTSHKYIYAYLESIVKKDKDLCFKSIDQLLTFPLVTVKQDFQEVLLDIIHYSVGYTSYTESAKKLSTLFGNSTIKVVKFLLSPWISEDIFKSDVEFQTGLLCVYQLLAKITSR